MILLTGFLFMGAVLQYWWPAWTIGTLLIVLTLSICWRLYEQATIHTLHDPLYPHCTGACRFNRACNCEDDKHD